MATAFNDPDQWRAATEPRGVHREAPLSADEKRAVGAFVEESDVVWEARLRAKEMAAAVERRRAEQAEADAHLANGRWA